MSVPPPPPVIPEVNIFVQLSTGRHPVTVLETDTLRDVKKRVKAMPGHRHLNMSTFTLFLDGRYLTDNSQTVRALKIPEGCTMHLVLKKNCPAAAVDTERKAE
eukprot:TRINITY_DN67066_c0_g1_i1.p3 TRINITY_DN67066_c0_g1~~TRINITY_DN67066_c0_g1_i1.p3  ORF type:complete len:103 (+),score=38.27 TRINITY_DN67066_c0_g1_i1:112-420(+)